MKITPKTSNSSYPTQDSAKSSKASGSSDLKAKNPLSNLGAQASAVGGSAKLDLSSRAQDVKKAFDVAKKAPDVDEAKVAKYQKLIDSGKYSVDAGKVADKMVDEMLMSEYGREE
jgi:negative regulator of flagellin synthesis FlgM